MCAQNRTHRAQRRLSLRLRWRAWRARFSVPYLLATLDERRAVALVAAVNAGLAIAVITLCAWITDLPLLFPALGPSAFIIYAKPFAPDAAPRCVIVAHFTGMASGWAAYWLVTLVSGSPASPDAGGREMVLAASLALAITCPLLVRFSAPHAPACATALVIAVGGVTQWVGLLAMALAIVILTFQSVCVNRLAGLNVPTWSPRSSDTSPTRPQPRA